MTTSLPGMPGSIQHIVTPEFKRKMRKRRPGYDGIVGLMATWAEMLSSRRASMEASEVASEYVVPTFQALGWSVVENAGDRSDATHGSDLVLGYRDLRVPVEVKTPGRLSRGDKPRAAGSWAIATDFQTIQIWDLRDTQGPRLLLETGPSFYVADDRESDDVLAAPVFYQRLVQPSGGAPSSGDEQPDVSRPDKPADFVSQLAKDLGSPDLAIRQVALHQLAKLPIREARKTSPVLKDLLDETDPGIRAEIARLLGKFRADVAKPGLMKLLLRDPDVHVRETAAWALGRIGGPESVQTLADCLLRQDEHADVRGAAAEALGNLKSQEAARDLQRVADDSNQPEQLRSSARLALNKIQVSERTAQQAEGSTIQGASEPPAVPPGPQDRPAEQVPAPESPVESAAEEQLRLRRMRIVARMLLDDPGVVDRLGFLSYAQAFADFLETWRNRQAQEPASNAVDASLSPSLRSRQPDRKALTIGIDADWGMGKTTLLHLLWNELAKRNDRQRPAFLLVWFDAWKYHQEGSLSAALALEVQKQARQGLRWPQQARLWSRLTAKRLDGAALLRALLRAVVPLSLAGGLLAVLWKSSTKDVLKTTQGKVVAAASLLALLYSVFKDYLAGLVRAFDTAIRQYLREVGYKERLGFQEEFEEDFRRIIDVVTNERQRSLVVFIDDLDRCAPPKAAEIIEAISFLPRAQNCAFVMAMDCKLVAASIEGKYKDLAGYLTDVNEPCSPTFGQRFLEKIIQVHFHIPRAEAKTMREFVESILNEIDSEAKPPTGIAGTAGGGPPESIAVAWATQMTRTHFLVPRPETKPPTSGTDVPVPGPSDTSGGIGAEPEPQTEAKLKQESFVDSFDEHQGVRDALAWAAPYLQFSPRRITRFINTFRLLALIANRSGLLENGRIELLPLAQWAVIATRWPAVIEGLLADTHFVEQLTEARNLLTIWRPESIHGPDPVTAEAAKAAKVEFEANLYFMSPRIKQLISEHDLFWVLKELGQALDDKERMSSYLRLAQMVHTSVRYQPTPILPQIGAES